MQHLCSHGQQRSARGGEDTAAGAVAEAQAAGAEAAGGAAGVGAAGAAGGGAPSQAEAGGGAAPAGACTGSVGSGSVVPATAVVPGRAAQGADPDGDGHNLKWRNKKEYKLLAN